jgi:hypothetical protein
MIYRPSARFLLSCASCAQGWGTRQFLTKELADEKAGLEARVGIEPTYKGFADLSLTTWVPRQTEVRCVVTKDILHSKPFYSILGS